MSVREVNNPAVPFLFKAGIQPKAAMKIAGSCKAFQILFNDPELWKLFVLKKYGSFLTEAEINFNTLTSDQRTLLYKSCVFPGDFKSGDSKSDEMINQIFLNKFSKQNAQQFENLKERKKQIKEDLNKIFNESTGELLLKQLEMKQEENLLERMDPGKKLLHFLQSNGEEIKTKMFDRITETIGLETVIHDLTFHLAEHLFHGSPLDQIKTDPIKTCAFLNHLYPREVKSILLEYDKNLPAFLNRLYNCIVATANFKKLDQLSEMKRRELEYTKKMVSAEAEKSLSINIFKEKMKNLIGNVHDLIEEKRTLHLLNTTIDLIPETPARVETLTSQEQNAISKSIEKLFSSSLDPIIRDVLRISHPREIVNEEFPIDFRDYLKRSCKRGVEAKISQLQELIESNSDFSEFLGNKSQPS